MTDTNELASRLAITADKHSEAVTRLLDSGAVPEELAEAARESRETARRLLELAGAFSDRSGS